MSIDPLAEDVWVASLMGPHHLFLAGQSSALCGQAWISVAWNVQPASAVPKFVCETCVLKVNEGKEER